MRKVCRKRGKVLKDWKIELFRYRNRSKNKKRGHINCKNKEMHLQKNNKIWRGRSQDMKLNYLPSNALKYKEKNKPKKNSNQSTNNNRFAINN